MEDRRDAVLERELFVEAEEAAFFGAGVGVAGTAAAGHVCA